MGNSKYLKSIAYNPKTHKFILTDKQDMSYEINADKKTHQAFSSGLWYYFDDIYAHDIKHYKQ